MSLDFKKMIIGRPLATWELAHEKFPTLFGLAILSSDAISSVAYATEEILLVLIPVIGALAYGYSLGISALIIGLLALLVFSYRQTIHAYPNGGGAFTVAKENLGTTAGLVAGASLAVDYILTVAVSTSAGTAAITSAFPTLITHKISISLALIILITIVNLRGVKESAKVFSLPTYLFVGSMLVLIIVGLIKHKTGVTLPYTNMEPSPIMGWALIIILLRAFSSGCSALTGLEAISNSVPNFKEPSPRNAVIALMLLALVVFIVFGGVAVLASVYHASVGTEVTVLSQIAEAVFGKNFMYYLIQFATALILVMASNTAFNGFPMLMSVIAQDGYAPRQLTLRGDRLSYSNGIIILAIIASVLIVIFRGDTHLLIPLYAVGVFTSFTLSQTGMTLRWMRGKEKGWRHKAFINGFGAIVTTIAVLIIGATKFIHGAWIVIVLIPIFVLAMRKIKRHYIAVADHLRIGIEELKQIDITPKYDHRIIVPLASINRAVVETIKYARSFTPNVTALHIAIDEEAAKKWEARWDEWNPGVPLVVKHSPYREVIDPFFEYIDSLIAEMDDDDKITVLIPQFITLKRWENYFLHNQTSFFLREGLLSRNKNIVVSNYPYYIDLDDTSVISKDVCDVKNKCEAEQAENGKIEDSNEGK